MSRRHAEALREGSRDARGASSWQAAEAGASSTALPSLDRGRGEEETLRRRAASLGEIFGQQDPYRKIQEQPKPQTGPPPPGSQVPWQRNRSLGKIKKRKRAGCQPPSSTSQSRSARTLATSLRYIFRLLAARGDKRRRLKALGKYLAFDLLWSLNLVSPLLLKA